MEIKDNIIRYETGDKVTTKKPHVCGENVWEVVRTGADYKLKCRKCGHIIMISSDKFRKIIKH